MNSNVILQTEMNQLNLLKKGKVRDVYDLGEYYLIVSTDRLSAFDVIMNQGIPDKGKILNTISTFWFEYTKDIINNHIVSTSVDGYPEVCFQYKQQLDGRSMLVKKTKVIPIECIVRGYLSGTGWNDYKETGKLCGYTLPQGLVESERLPNPIFTPSTKAEIGDHDENISVEKAKSIAGEEVITKMERAAINIFNKCSAYALERGIIIADTKMEFGIDETGELIIIDELLTPDSSRFWPLSNYGKGRGQQSYDKQFVRDFLISINFNKQPPPPELPDEIISKTREKYSEVLEILTGRILY
ncbi:MAG: phosphoribosylaminoimidazolesuccinocarboxamide synthase [Ignavibacteriaceae bacterium]|nr:phosphoribosylaminoimidazolesuccinocarboxamide synthase [Ignavibacteriaceae bacterium]